MHRTTVERPQGTFDWLHFAARSGEEGEAWAEGYRRWEPFEQGSIEALTQLRRGDLEAGRATLARLRGELEGCTAPPSVRCVLERWYFGVLGFLHYRQGEHDAAEEAMIAAHEAVAEAVGRRRFLLLLANHCHEFSLHRARIARNRRRWEEMNGHLELARGMMRDEVPLCLVADGEPVYFSTLADHFRALPLSDEERASLADLFDAETRLRLFDRFVHNLHVQPGFAIQYP